MPIKSFTFRLFTRLRRTFARNLGLTDSRKWLIYQDICESVSLSSSSYWLQVLFAAGIATLGLVLNSPAVIIGAMLISPLMGGILAMGLALAVGDVILVLRATLTLILSCLAAIALAMLLVSCLPFKEITSEILARTQPNLLDLMVALFSGAVGSVAICQENKGVATSLPGVAIAVALMPPLCVVGYGIGIALTVEGGNGFEIARGGGLLFFTNFVAIVFTAMIVFFLVNLDTKNVREQAKQWQVGNGESQKIQSFLNYLPSAKSLEKIGSLPGRFFLIIITILVISFPLNQSLFKLRQEIRQKQQENQLRSLVTSTWSQTLGKLSNGDPRSYINHLAINEPQTNLNIELQVVTSKFYSQTEQETFVNQIAQALRRKPESINLKLVEIPTGRFTEAIASPEVTVISIFDLQSQLRQQIKVALQSITLPPPAQLLTSNLTISPNQPLQLELIYLSDRPIQADGQTLLTKQIRNQLNINDAIISYNYLASVFTVPTFTAEQKQLSSAQIKQLESVAKILQRYTDLSLEIQIPKELDKSAIALNQIDLIHSYFSDRWQIPETRLQEIYGQSSQDQIILRLADKSDKIKE